jgi:CHAT domain-containing protein
MERRPMTTRRDGACRIVLLVLAAAAALGGGPAMAEATRWAGRLDCTDPWGNQVQVPAEATLAGGQAAITVGQVSVRRPVDGAGGFTVGVALGRDHRVGHLRATPTPHGLALRPDGGEVSCSGLLQALAPAPAAPPAAVPAAPADAAVTPAPAMLALAAPAVPLGSARIDDLLALIQREREQAGRRLAATRALAEAPEPEGSAEARADFLARRAFANWSLERNHRAVADFRRAFEIARSVPALPVLERTWYQYHLGLALFRTGDLAQALAALDQAAGDLRAAIDADAEADRLLWHSVVWEGFLARAHAATGDIEAADTALRRAAEGFARLAAAPPRVLAHERALGEAALAQARAVRAELAGDTTAADGLHRQAIMALAPFRDWPKNRWLPPERLDQIRLDALLARADALARAGRSAEALALARQVVAEIGEAARGEPHAMVQAARVVVEALGAEGRPQDAARLAAAAIAVLEAAGGAPDSALRIGLWLARGRAHAAERDWPAALGAFERLRTDLGGTSERLARALRGDPTYALVLLKAGRGGEALAAAEAAWRRAQALFGERHPAAAEAAAIRATVLAAAGRREEAMEAYRAAMPVLIEATAGPYAGETLARAVRLRAVVEAYLHELARGIAAGPAGVPATGQHTLVAVDAMLRAAEAARSRTLLDAVAAAAVRSGLKDRAVADLVRRDQDAARRIVALHDSLAGWFQLPTNARKQADEAALRQQIAATEAERSELGRAIAARAPALAALARPAPAGTADLRAALKPGEAVVTVLVGDERSVAIALGRQGPPMVVEAPLGRAAIAASVARLRSAMTDGGRGVAAIPPYDVETAFAELYQPLLKPLEPAFATAPVLLVVADGALAQIPWAMLPTGPAERIAPAGAPRFAEYRRVPWLIRRHAVAHLPSVTALVALRRMTPAATAPRPFVGIGDPAFTGAPARPDITASPLRAGIDHAVALRTLESLPALPDTRLELEFIAKTLGADSRQELYLGSRASEGEIRRAPLDRYRVVAFATHGLAPGDVDGLTQPALALSSPRVTAEEDDGLLTMSEVMDLRLAADWVVLSACNTAGEAAPGAEALSGLASAFFYAGTRSVLATHWAVETVSARLLTTGAFAARAPNRAEALRRSMLALIDGGPGGGASDRAGFSYAHPLFWAPFALVGDPG